MTNELKLQCFHLGLLLAHDGASPSDCANSFKDFYDECKRAYDQDEQAVLQALNDLQSIQRGQRKAEAKEELATARDFRRSKAYVGIVMQSAALQDAVAAGGTQSDALVQNKGCFV